jgi:hypothetical protein
MSKCYCRACESCKYCDVELELVDSFKKYLDFDSIEPKSGMFGFIDKYPEAQKELWRFFCGRVDRIDKYPELYDLHDALHDFMFKYH